MIITKEIRISMGHRVPNHKSKCKTPHGHEYLIECGVNDKVITEEGASDEGMVIDFGSLKDIMMEVIDTPFDHSGCFYENDWKRNIIIDFYEDCPKLPIFVPFIPTAENLAKHWYELMKLELERVGIKIKHVKVYETPSSAAIYIN